MAVLDTLMMRMMRMMRMKTMNKLAGLQAGVGTFLVGAILIAVGEIGHTAESRKNVLLIAGRPSHGPGQHEHNAGVQLFAKCLREGASNLVSVDVSLNGTWPAEELVRKADTIVLYSDGGSGHVAAGHYAEIGEQIKRGCGLVCIHYAVEPAYEPENWPEFVPPVNGKPSKQTAFNPERSSKGAGAREWREWLGGYFEQYWSVNPHWTADFKELPKHPVSRGVKPFGTKDEWYYHMRFRDGMKRVTPILSDLPPTSTTERGEGPHSGNPEQKREVLELKSPQHVAWAIDREDGGRGVGFTGGHFHSGWGNSDQRKLVLNAILWTARAEVPDNGIESSVSEAELSAHLDPKPDPKGKQVQEAPRPVAPESSAK